MLYAQWRRPGAARVLASVPPAAPTSTRVDVGHGVLWATAPARLERTPDGGIAWQHPFASDGDSQEPDVRLSAGSLQITAGPLPQYPLYYYRAPDDALFVVCSELAPLVPAYSRGTDVGRLVALLGGQEAEPGATPYVGLRRLRACEHISVEDDGVRTSLRMPRAGTSYLPSRPEDLAVELRARLEAAVARAIGNARRVAVQVGGGLDSSGVLALAVARGAGQREVEALAEVWASPGDDRPHLKTLEDALGIVAVRLPARDAAPWFGRSLCVDAQPQPFGGACLDMLLSATAVARGAEVALGGHAGDEVCGGEVSFAPLVLQGRPVQAAVNALRLQMPWPYSPFYRLSHWVVGPLVRPFLPKRWLVAELRRRRRSPWMTPRFVKLLDPYLAAIPRRLPGTPDEQMERFCSLPFFAEISVLWGQIASVTGAAPVDVFRDLELVRFISQVNPVVLSHGHTFRGLYRLAMKGVLPESIRLRRDKALGHPAVAEAAVGADAGEMLRDLSSLERLASLDLVKPEVFREPFAMWLRTLLRGERLLADPTDESWHRIWQLLSVEALLRKDGTAG